MGQHADGLIDVARTRQLPVRLRQECGMCAGNLLQEPDAIGLRAAARADRGGAARLRGEVAPICGGHVG